MEPSISKIFPRWFFPFCNIMGILPIKISGDTVSFSWSSAVRATVFVAGSVFSHCTYLSPTRYDEDATVLTIATKFINVIFWLVLSVLLFFVMMFNIISGRFRTIVKNLKAVSGVLLNVSGKSLTDSFDNCLAAMITCYVLLGCLCGVQIWTEYGQEYFWRCFPERAVLMNLFIGVEIMFIKIVRIIDKNFELLNESVYFCCNANDNGSECSVSTLAAVHRKLCHAIAGCNALFGPALLIVFTNLFIVTVFAPYFVVEAVDNPHTRVAHVGLFVATNVSIIAFHATTLLAITWVASQATTNAKDTAFHVSRLLSLDLDKSTRKEVKHALAQVCADKSEFTVCGLFNVDLPLILSFVGMAVTYLLVMIQLEAYD